LKHPNAENVQLVCVAAAKVVFFKHKSEAHKKEDEQVVKEVIDDGF
jgi:hypothetical protein